MTKFPYEIFNCIKKILRFVGFSCQNDLFCLSRFWNNKNQNAKYNFVRLRIAKLVYYLEKGKSAWNLVKNFLPNEFVLLAYPRISSLTIHEIIDLIKQVLKSFVSNKTLKILNLWKKPRAERMNIDQIVLVTLCCFAPLQLTQGQILWYFPEIFLNINIPIY